MFQQQRVSINSLHKCCYNPSFADTIPDEETALLNSAALGKRVLPSHVSNQVQENEHGQKMVISSVK